MTEQKIVLEFTEQQIRDLDAMATEGFRVLRDDCTHEQRTAAAAIVHRIDANRRALLAGEAAPDAKPDSQAEWGFSYRFGGEEWVARCKTEETARSEVDRLATSRTLLRREVGPWIEVTS